MQYIYVALAKGAESYSAARYEAGDTLTAVFHRYHMSANEPGGQAQIVLAAKKCCKQILEVCIAAQMKLQLCHPTC